MHAQQERRLGPDRAVVVGRARPVRRPHLDQARAGAGEHVRNPEAVADLDQLPARDDDLAALGERGEGEQHRGGVVVDDDRRLGAREPPQQRREVILARPARPAREVVLEVGVAADLGDPVEGGRRQRRAPEVRVDQDPGGVEHAAERRPPCRGELLGQPRRRSPGSPPARISSRARSSSVRAAATASGSSTSRTSSSTEGRSRSLTPMSVEPPQRILCKCETDRSHPRSARRRPRRRRRRRRRDPRRRLLGPASARRPAARSNLAAPVDVTVGGEDLLRPTRRGADGRRRRDTGRTRADRPRLVPPPRPRSSSTRARPSCSSTPCSCRDRARRRPRCASRPGCRSPAERRSSRAAGATR